MISSFLSHGKFFFFFCLVFQLQQNLENVYLITNKQEGEGCGGGIIFFLKAFMSAAYGHARLL